MRRLGRCRSAHSTTRSRSRHCGSWRSITSARFVRAPSAFLFSREATHDRGGAIHNESLEGPGNHPGNLRTARVVAAGNERPRIEESCERNRRAWQADACADGRRRHPRILTPLPGRWLQASALAQTDARTRRGARVPPPAHAHLYR